MPNINRILNCFNCFTPKHSMPKSESIKDVEIFRLLSLWQQDKSAIISELSTEQVKLAIKHYKDSNANPLPDIHFYFPDTDLNSLPDFLLLLLMKYGESKNNVVFYTLRGEFKITTEFISDLKTKRSCQQITLKKPDGQGYGDSNYEKYFVRSIREYFEKVSDHRIKDMLNILTFEIYLSERAHYECPFMDDLLLAIDIKRMAEKNHFYHLFSKADDIFDIFRDETFRAFTDSSSKQTEFNFIFRKNPSHKAYAVSVQKKDGKLTFIVINTSNSKELITIEKLKDHYRVINQNESCNTKEKLQNPLMSTSNNKIITLNLRTQKNDFNSLISARDSMGNLLKNKKFLDELSENVEYGESILFDFKSNPSVVDMVDPNLVKLSQISDITNEYIKSFHERGLLDTNVRKNKSNEPQTLEQFIYQHSKKKEKFNPSTKQSETSLRNEAVIDKRRKLFRLASDHLSCKLNIDNQDLRHCLEKSPQVNRTWFKEGVRNFV